MAIILRQANKRQQICRIFCGCCFGCNSRTASATASLIATRLLARSNEVLE